MTRREFMIAVAVLAATAVVLRHVLRAASEAQPVSGGWQVPWQFPWQFGAGQETAAIYLPAVKR
jgi:hypothetical protein